MFYANMLDMPFNELYFYAPSSTYHKNSFETCQPEITPYQNPFSKFHFSVWLFVSCVFIDKSGEAVKKKNFLL